MFINAQWLEIINQIHYTVELNLYIVYTSVVTKDYFIYMVSQGTTIMNNTTEQKYFLLKLVEILSAKIWLKNIKTFAKKIWKIFFIWYFLTKKKRKLKNHIMEKSNFLIFKFQIKFIVVNFLLIKKIKKIRISKVLGKNFRGGG